MQQPPSPPSPPVAHTPAGDLSEAGLQLQISLLCCQALEAADPLEFLREHVQFHNLAEIYVSDSLQALERGACSPVRFLLAMSDSRTLHGAGCRPELQAKLEPTVYVSFHNSVAAVTGFPSRSLANFLCCPLPANCHLAPGAQMQGLAVSLMDGLPMQTFFNLLGRGYKLVLSGHQFGAVMAHALACHLLLQLQHEILMAEEMGVNLSALAMTLDKVASYGFGAPFFGDAQLHSSLQQYGLEANINSIWKLGDASMSLFSLCSELAAAIPPAPPSIARSMPGSGTVSVAAVMADAEGRGLSEDGGGAGAGAAPSNHSGAFSGVGGSEGDGAAEPFQRLTAAQVRSPQLQSLQRWAVALPDKMHSAAPRRPQPAVTQAFELKETYLRGEFKAAELAALRDGAGTPVGPPAPAPPSAAATAAAVGAAAAKLGALKAGGSSSSGSGSPLPDRPSPTRLGLATAGPSRSSASGVGSDRSHTPNGSSSPAPHAATARGGHKGTQAAGKAIMESSRAISTIKAAVALRRSAPGHEGSTSPGAAARAPAGPDAHWRDALRDLVRLVDEAAAQEAGAPTRFVPVGRLWALEHPPSDGLAASAGTGSGPATPRGAAPPRASPAPTSAPPPSPPPPSPKAGGKAAAAAAGPAAAMAAYIQSNMVLAPISHPKAAAARAWLSADNPDLFLLWEYRLEEFKEDLLEAFAWTTFQLTARAAETGTMQPRQQLLRPLHSITIE